MFQYSLAALVVVTTVLAGCFAVMYYSFGLSVAVLIMASLCLARLGVYRYNRRTGAMPYLLSAVGVVLLLPCGGITMLATCTTATTGLSELPIPDDSAFKIGACLGMISALQLVELMVVVMDDKQKP